MSASSVTSELPPGRTTGLSGDQRRSARRCLSLLGALGSGSLLGIAFSLYLANHNPLLLIALSPIGRHLILVAPTVDPAAFVAVAACRRLLFYLPCFQLGRTLGPDALDWIEARAKRTGRFVRWLERLFQRAPRAVVFALPGPGMSTIAGVSGMPLRVYAPLVGAGLVLRMILIVALGEWLRAPIERLLAIIDEYWVPGTVVLVAGVIAFRWRQRRLERRALIDLNAWSARRKERPRRVSAPGDDRAGSPRRG